MLHTPLSARNALAVGRVGKNEGEGSDGLTCGGGREKIGRMKDAHDNPVPGQVIFHAGYRGRQEPRRILIAGRDHAVTEVLSRGRIRDSGSGIVREDFVCRIDHRTVRICVFYDGIVKIFTQPE